MHYIGMLDFVSEVILGVIYVRLLYYFGLL